MLLPLSDVVGGEPIRLMHQVGVHNVHHLVWSPTWCPTAPPTATRCPIVPPSLVGQWDSWDTLAIFLLSPRHQDWFQIRGHSQTTSECKISVRIVGRASFVSALVTKRPKIGWREAGALEKGFPLPEPKLSFDDIIAARSGCS